MQSKLFKFPQATQLFW